MKKKIIINITSLSIVVVASIALCIFVMISCLAKEDIQSMDLLIAVGTPFFILIIDLLVGKACISSIKNMKEYIKIPLENRNDVIKVGKDYKENNSYVMRLSQTIAFLGFFGGIILIILYFTNTLEAIYGIGCGIIAIVVSIIAFLIFLYYNKLQQFDDYEIGKMYIEKLKK